MLDMLLTLVAVKSLKFNTTQIISRDSFAESLQFMCQWMSWDEITVISDVVSFIVHIKPTCQAVTD